MLIISQILRSLLDPRRRNHSHNLHSIHRPSAALFHWRSILHRHRLCRMGIQSEAVSGCSHGIAPLFGIQNLSRNARLNGGKCSRLCQSPQRRRISRSHPEPSVVLWHSWLPPCACCHRPPTLHHVPARPHPRISLPSARRRRCSCSRGSQCWRLLDRAQDHHFHSQLVREKPHRHWTHSNICECSNRQSFQSICRCEPAKFHYWCRGLGTLNQQLLLLQFQRHRMQRSHRLLKRTKRTKVHIALLLALQRHVTLCTCTGLWAEPSAPSAAVAAPQLPVRSLHKPAATIMMKMGTDRMSQVCSPIYSRTCCSRFRRWSPGTIAGSVNLASDSTPSAFRNNGVAGASALGASARGAQLYFQVQRSPNTHRAVRDACAGHSKQSQRRSMQCSRTSCQM